MIKEIKCAFCSGIGKDPFNLLSPLSDCLVCNGTGHVSVKEPMVKCIFCDGSGKNPLGARIACIVCGGKGHNYSEGTTKCTQCRGIGKSGDGLPCSKCGGIGLS